MTNPPRTHIRTSVLLDSHVVQVGNLRPIANRPIQKMLPARSAATLLK
jgi:hypothetical protein